MFVARFFGLLAATLTATALCAETGTRPDPATATIPAPATPEEAIIAPGDSLDRILGRAGISPQVRAEAALALEGVYDLTDLRPGHVLRWTPRRDDPSGLASLTLFVGAGVEIDLSFADSVEARLIEPELTVRDRSEVLELNGSLYDALAARDAPVRFAVDLTALLAGQVDFRRDIRGGESFSLVWQEDRLPDGTIAGEPRLSYARLTIGGRDLELVATDAASPVQLFENGVLIQRSAPPILGARLSSVFGNRTHPVLGGRRMHTGVDYAAPRGTPVNATGAGRVVFAGIIRGYGRTLDIDHGAGVATRYAHLSQIATGLRPGSRVLAGDRIGAVGATGMVTGPNLHYEVRVNGRPVDPMEDVVPGQIVTSAADIDALAAGRAATGYRSSLP